VRRGVCAVGLLTILGWAGAAHTADERVFGPRDFSVFAYDLTLRIDRAHRQVAGRETMRVRCTGDRVQTIRFPRNGIAVQSVRSGQGDALPTLTLTANDQIEIQLPVALARGQETSIVVEYSATEPKGIAFQADAVYSGFHTCHWMICR
jgi:hypothetical protein